MYPQIANIKLLDELIVTQRTVSPGGIFNHLKMYFKSGDQQTGIVRATLDKAGKRETLITIRAIQTVIDAITGEVKYTRDPRNILLGNNL